MEVEVIVFKKYSNWINVSSLWEGFDNNYILNISFVLVTFQIFSSLLLLSHKIHVWEFLLE